MFRWFSLFLAVLFSHGCGPSANFSDSYQKLIQGKKDDEPLTRRLGDAEAAAAANAAINGGGGRLALSCQDEGSGGNFVREASEPWLDVEFSPVCPIDEVISSSHEEEKIANIVFVIDITGSMQDNIDTVSNHITAFSQALTAQQWRVNFAAVLFKDQVWKTLPFASASSLSQALRRWPAEGGGINHPQEAGLQAIERAATLLADYSASQSDAEQFKNIVLYVSDAPAFYRNDRDFAVGRVSQAVRDKLAANWQNFRLYYSVNADWDAASPLPNPAKQMVDLAAALGTVDKPLGFPLTEEAIMKRFLAEFGAWTNEEPLVCYIKDIALNDAGASGAEFAVTKFDEGWTALGQAIPAEGRIRYGRQAVEGALQVRRCCSPENEVGSSCVQELTSPVNFRRP